MSANSDPIPFEFTGRGADYFRIWIVNLFLSVITLGIYSAWAKVRRVKYFYNNTSLDGAIFDYHADPMSILRGRMIAVPVLLVIGVLDQFLHGFAFPVVWLALAPWVVVNSLRFNAANTSYRGLRFGFVGRPGEAYRIMSLELLYVIFTLGLLFPLWRYRFKRYVMSNLRYGDKAFQFGTPLGAFVVGYAAAFGAGIALAVVLSVVLAPLGMVAWALVPLAIMGLLLTCGTYLVVRNRNLVFNHLGLGPEPVPAELVHAVNPAIPGQMQLHRFISTLKLGPCVGVWTSNYLLILITLGLFVPFAAIRNIQLLADNTLLMKSATQEAASAVAAGSHSALGSEAGDTGNIDIGL